MKKFVLWFALGVAAITCVGFVVTQPNNIYLLNSDNGEIKIKIRAGDGQTAPFIECVKGGSNVFSVAADGTVTPALSAGAATYVTSATLTNKVGVSNLVLGTLPLGMWVTTNDSRAITNLAGDFTLEAASTFLQMNATGGGAGYKYFDFYNGGSTFNLRRKADGGGSVLDSVFSVSSAGIAFGVPVNVNSLELPALDNIPTNAIPPSSAARTNWVLINWTNTGPVFIATNIAAAGSFLKSIPTVTTTAWP